jgi:hypothetical protein
MWFRDGPVRHAHTVLASDQNRRGIKDRATGVRFAFAKLSFHFFY